MTAEEQPPLLCTPEILREQRIDSCPDTAAKRLASRQHELVVMDGSTVRYDRLLLATGATARSWMVPGGRAHPCDARCGRCKTTASNIELWKLRRVDWRRFHCLELVASAVARGCCVTVLEQLSQVMGRAVPESVAEVVAARHTQSGVSLFCNTEVAEICQADSGFTVTATDGLSWRADLVIARIGEVPETQLAEGCGLEVENGIRVNEQLRTSNPDIYPAVYCCLFPHSLFGHRRIPLEMWHGARRASRVRRPQPHRWQRGVRGGSVVLVESVRLDVAGRRASGLMQ